MSHEAEQIAFPEARQCVVLRVLPRAAEQRREDPASFVPMLAPRQRTLQRTRATKAFGND